MQEFTYVLRLSLEALAFRDASDFYQTVLHQVPACPAPKSFDQSTVISTIIDRFPEEFLRTFDPSIQNACLQSFVICLAADTNRRILSDYKNNTHVLQISNKSKAAIIVSNYSPVKVTDVDD